MLIVLVELIRKASNNTHMKTIKIKQTMMVLVELIRTASNNTYIRTHYKNKTNKQTFHFMLISTCLPVCVCLPV